MDDDAMRSFQTALSKNPHIVVLEVEGNPVSSNTEIKTLAEAAANRLIKELHHDQLSLNASLLTITVTIVLCVCMKKKQLFYGLVLPLGI